jgi:WD40 repeat protein
MCLAEKYGFIAIGGIEGEFELYCCMNNKPTKIWGTKFKGKNNVLLLTNAIQIIRFEHQNEFRYYLIACMNDAGILVYELSRHTLCPHPPTLQYHIRAFDRAPINDARISPDGQHLVCVGDAAYLFHLTVAFDDGHLVLGAPTKRAIAVDSVFSSQYLAWSKSSLYFAHTSDSHHTVFVWRTQPLELVHRIDAAGYTYAVQFHPAFEGVLVFSNRYGYVHTVNLEEQHHQHVRHEITMVSFRGEKNTRLRILAKINGLQWSNDGRYLYVATKKRVLAYEFTMQTLLSLEKTATITALQLMDQEIQHARKKRKLCTEQWKRDIPVHIQHTYNTQLATHF